MPAGGGHRIWCAGGLAPAGPTRSGSVTAPRSPPERASCTWHRCWTSSPDGWSGSPCPNTTTPNWPTPPSRPGTPPWSSSYAPGNPSLPRRPPAPGSRPGSMSTTVSGGTPLWACKARSPTNWPTPAPRRRNNHDRTRLRRGYLSRSENLKILTKKSLRFRGMDNSSKYVVCRGFLRRDLTPGPDGPGTQSDRRQTRPGPGEGVPQVGDPRRGQVAEENQRRHPARVDPLTAAQQRGTVGPGPAHGRVAGRTTKHHSGQGQTTTTRPAQLPPCAVRGRLVPGHQRHQGRRRGPARGDRRGPGPDGPTPVAGEDPDHPHRRGGGLPRVAHPASP